MPSKKRLPKGVDMRPSGLFRARVWHGERQVSLGTFHTAGDAEAALMIARGEMARGIFVPPAELRRQEREAVEAAERERAAQEYTVQDLFEDWMAWQERRGLKQGTTYSRRSRYESRLQATFGQVAVRDVTPKMVTVWYDEARAEKPGAAREALSTLSQMYSYATGEAAHLPAGHEVRAEINPARITTPGRKKALRAPHREVATPDEISDLAGRMPEHERLTVLLGAWCGLRIGEVLGLRRRDFWEVPAIEGDTAAQFLRVERQVQARGGGLREETVKTSAGLRDIPVPMALWPVVQVQLQEWAGLGEDGLLFPREQRGRYWMHPNSLRGHFNAARDAHNVEAHRAKVPTLEGFIFHDLRKTALTRVGRAGATGAELMRFGGHADLEAVQIYQRADLDRLARLAEIMDGDVVVPRGPAAVTSIRGREAS